ncbi:phage portal protein [Planctomycetes bacterium TBK1r]|uniref:Phage portal protein n=1 Tax=Stieleria magnilauensis TaxID=2527963 RepID=A0ABX5XY17_9BACT|nr:Phage portal protein [Planctomycetes bacterium TBK1r]QDV87006.1 Phage portal protein [Planctomycetes bacterium TBK1r]
MFDWIKGIFRQSKPTDAAGIVTGLSDPAEWFINWVGGGSTSESGVKVNWETALGYPPVWYGVSKLCGHMSQMPLHVHRRLPRGAEVALRERGDYLMNVEPNKYQMPAVFREELMVHSLLGGNGRAVMIQGAGRVEELLPIHPDRSTTKMIKGDKWHATEVDEDDRLMRFKDLDYIEVEGRTFMIPDEYVLHIPGLSCDGLAGLYAMKLFRNSWGLGLASEKAANKHFSSGANPGGFVRDPRNELKNETKAREFLADWNRHHQGVDNAGKWGLLRGEMEAQAFEGSGAKDNEWVQQRLFQRQEAALTFMLESILGDDDSVSYNSIEQKNLAYLVNSLMRWVTKWEQECDRKLLSNRQKERRTHFFKMEVKALLRTDSKTSMETLGMGIVHRIYSPNEARQKLDMNPYEGGDEYQNPAISPGSATETGDDTDEGDETDSAEDAKRKAYAGRIEHLMSVEQKHVRKAAASQKNFLNWADKFYIDTWPRTLARAVEQLGGDPESAKRHCSDRFDAMLSVLDSVQPEQLSAAVDEATEDLSQCVEQLVDDILLAETVS